MRILLPLRTSFLETTLERRANGESRRTHESLTAAVTGVV